jgi:hypothetical protein
MGPEGEGWQKEKEEKMFVIDYGLDLVNLEDEEMSSLEASGESGDAQERPPMEEKRPPMEQKIPTVEQKRPTLDRLSAKPNAPGPDPRPRARGEPRQGGRGDGGREGPPPLPRGSTGGHRAAFARTEMGGGVNGAWEGARGLRGRGGVQRGGGGGGGGGSGGEGGRGRVELDGVTLKVWALLLDLFCLLF